MNLNENLPPDETKSYEQRIHEGWNTPANAVVNALKEVTNSPIVGEPLKIKRGESNEVFIVQAEDKKEYIIRIFHGANLGKFEKEKWAIEHCADSSVGVPVPQVLFVGTKPVGDEFLPVSIESKITGEILKDKEGELSIPELNSYLIQIGEILHKIHSVETNGYGKLDKDGNGEFETIQELILDFKSSVNDVILPGLKNRLNDQEIIKKAYAILTEKVDRILHSPSKLIHNDLSPEHVFIQGGRISGIIDFESANGADPVVDLALWDLKFNKKYPLDYILDGYYDGRDKVPEDFKLKLNFWKIYRSLTRLRHCIKEGKPNETVDKVIRDISESLKYFS